MKLIDKEEIIAEIEKSIMWKPKYVIQHRQKKEIEESNIMRETREATLRNVIFLIDNMPEKRVWNKGDEEPKDNSKVIICQIGDETQSVLTMEYHCSDKQFHVTSPLGNDYTIALKYPKVRWAYPEDILPNK